MRYKGEFKTKCPYYIKESDQSITCEGFKKDTCIAHKFINKDKKEEYQEEECFRYPNKCTLSIYHDNTVNLEQKRQQNIKKQTY